LTVFGSVRLASRLAAVGAAAVVAGVGVAGCSSSSSTADASPVVSTTSSAAASSPAAPSASATGAGLQPAATAAASSTSSAGASGAPACASMDLGAHVGLAQGTAGSIYQVIYFTNLSNTACSLYGYPGVSLASGAAASRSTATAAAVVTLAAGQSANATLRIVEAGNYPTATCKPTATTFLQIFPPGQTTPIYLAYKSTGCASSSVNLLSITVMTAGTGG
jgi:hypothetical protein